MADTIHRRVLLGFVAVGIVGFAAWRSLGPAPRIDAARRDATQPSAQLAGLLPYAAPLSDSQMIAATRSPLGGSEIVLRDPFGVVVAAARAPHVRQTGARSGATPAAEWNVSATLLAGDRRAAVIDDQLVYVGDRVPGGGTLTQVERDHVLVVDAKGATHVVAVQEGNT